MGHAKVESINSPMHAFTYKQLTQDQNFALLAYTSLPTPQIGFAVGSVQKLSCPISNCESQTLSFYVSKSC